MNLIVLPVVDSTNSHALRLAEQGMAPEGTVVLAWEQTSGRGQRGSSWSSLPGQGLYFSLVLTPPAGTLPNVAGLIKALACGVARYLLTATGIQPAIKWPNDLLMGDRKVAGILMESILRNDELAVVVFGVGINLNHSSFNDSYLREPVSLHQLLNETFDPETEASAVYRFSMEAYRRFLKEGPEAFATEYNDLLYGVGKECRFSLEGKEIAAVFNGVNKAGEAEITFNGHPMRYPHPVLRFLSC